MASIKLTLPYPPPVNNLYANFRGRRILSKRGRDFHAQVAVLCLENRIKPLSGFLQVSLKAFRPRKQGDLDGIFKILFDSLKGAAFADDRQIVRIAAERFDDKASPRIELEISQCADCD